MDDIARRRQSRGESVENEAGDGWPSPSQLFDDHYDYSQYARQADENLPVNTLFDTPDTTSFDTLTVNNPSLDAPFYPRGPPPSHLHNENRDLNNTPFGLNTPSHEESRSQRRWSTSSQASSSPDTPQSTSATFVDLTEDSPIMPPSSRPSRQTKRTLAEASKSTSTPAKRRRVDPAPSTVEEVDLRDVNSDSDLARVLERQRAATVRAQQDEADKPTKLAGVTCVVCMEEMTNITVTHCGHMFCHTCLMECLIAGENQDGKGQSKCPMCRKIVKRPKDGAQSSQVIPLEIKVTTEKRTGI